MEAYLVFHPRPAIDIASGPDSTNQRGKTVLDLYWLIQEQTVVHPPPDPRRATDELGCPAATAGATPRIVHTISIGSSVEE
jgi:hypothetical protein